MASAIERFSVLYASCPVLVTSRIVGYEDAPLSDDFETFQLARFDRQEVSKFAEKLIKVIARKTKDEGAKQAKEFVKQTEHVASDLRENPLMLGLMVYLFVNRGEVPAYRPEIYKECALLMFEKWDQNRNIIFDRPRDFDLLDLFSFLAREIFGNSERENGVILDWLRQKTRLFFQEYYVERPRAVQTAAALVDFVTGRAWVMCDVGPKIYKFTHRTFLEFFVARELISQSVGVPDLIKDRLLSHVKRSEWEVMSHLALHMAVYRDGGKMRQAADTLFHIVTNAEVQDEEQAVLCNFTACALEYSCRARTTLSGVRRKLYFERQSVWERAATISHR